MSRLIVCGIPLLGLLICTLGGRLCYRAVKVKRIGTAAAVLVYLCATALPLGLAVVAIRLGGYLALRHRNFVFFGEDTLGLVLLMWAYLGLAIVSNAVLWVALSRE